MWVVTSNYDIVNLDHINRIYIQEYSHSNSRPVKHAAILYAEDFEGRFFLYGGNVLECVKKKEELAKAISAGYNLFEIGKAGQNHPKWKKEDKE